MILETPHKLEIISFVGVMCVGFMACFVAFQSFSAMELFGTSNPLRLSRYLSKRKTTLIRDKYTASVKRYVTHLCCFYCLILIQLFFLPFSYETNMNILFFANAPVVAVLTVIVFSDLAVLNLTSKVNRKELTELLELIPNDYQGKVVDLMKENPKDHFTKLDIALYRKHVKYFQSETLRELDNYKL